SIQRQFHHLLRMVPRNGLVVANASDANVMEVLDMGCWTPVERFGATENSEVVWRPVAPDGGDYTSFTVLERGRRAIDVEWSMPGRHNAENALAAMLAARHAGVDLATAARALREFRGVKRRMEV